MAFLCYARILLIKMNKRKEAAKWILFALAILLNAFIIINSCMNGNQSSAESGRVTNIIKNIINFFIHNAINDSNYETFHGVIRKLVGHFGLFLLDGVIVSWDIHFLIQKKWWIKLIISLSFGLLIGIITETIQLSVPGRSGEITDVLIDFSGYLLGALMIGLILFFIIRNFRKKKALDAQANN